LGSVAELERQGVDPRTVRPGTRYIGLENIGGDGGFSDAEATEAETLASTKFAFSDRHVLYGKLRPYLRKTVRPDFSGICSTDIIPIAPSQKLDRGYLFHFLRTDEVVGLATSMCSGANLPRISPKHIVNFKIPLPPVDEQRRIAAILDQADSLRRKRLAALQQTEALRKSIFDSMFGGQSALSGWPTKELADVVRAGTIITYGMVQAGEEFEGGVPYIRTGDIVGGEILVNQLRRADPVIAARFDRARVAAGDIVMSIRATVGTTAMVPPELDGANLTQGTAKIAPGAATDPLYLLDCLRSSPSQAWISKQVKGATFREITLGRLREMPIPIPPLDRQKLYSKRVQALMKTQSLQKTQLGQLDSLFAALQHRAFAGEL
jgi:type I restriction enzyme S subunit